MSSSKIEYCGSDLKFGHSTSGLKRLHISLICKGYKVAFSSLILLKIVYRKMDYLGNGVKIQRLLFNWLNFRAKKSKLLILN